MATTDNVGGPQRSPGSSMAGPLVIGGMFLHILFGLLTVQVYLYHLAFPRDKVWMKLMVYGVYLVLLAQDVFITYDAYQRETIQQAGAGLGWFFVPVLGGIVGFVVQAFYAWRIYKLSERRVVTVLLALIAFVSNIAAIISAGFGSRARSVAELNSSRGLRICSTVWYIGSAVCDILIAGYMIHLLTRNGGPVGNIRMVVRRIIRLTIETNSLTAGVAVITVVLLLVYPGKIYFTAPSLVLPSIYANTLLVMLNLRIRVSQVRDTEVNDRSMASLTFNAPSGDSCGHCSRRLASQSHVARPTKMDLEREHHSHDRDEHSRSEDVALYSLTKSGVAYQ
ncbi:hypothetical protein Moror_2415 [Moniliophthora roreri MCA 2997]|uniref:DUF6534 domain-containing protein n=1 Tax=Moniliophthora roreri (strain MCA 2997) TaxID=1381753 RepID=V2WW47_MONRO|nr:hypothetical protein Moror_2415 [Moniliophthora roreri MCA 2997]